jgi:hypothetical protein|tara:strand:- start:55 stop:666 length:612 start_codon:yes stop_codon:yes gene_type:complete
MTSITASALGPQCGIPFMVLKGKSCIYFNAIGKNNGTYVTLYNLKNKEGYKHWNYLRVFGKRRFKHLPNTKMDFQFKPMVADYEILKNFGQTTMYNGGIELFDTLKLQQGGFPDLLAGYRVVWPEQIELEDTTYEEIADALLSIWYETGELLAEAKLGRYDGKEELTFYNINLAKTFSDHLHDFTYTNDKKAYLVKWAKVNFD